MAAIAPASSVSAQRDVLVEVDRAGIPRRVGVHQVLVVRGADRRRLRAAEQEAPAELAARLEPREELLSVRERGRAVEPPRGGRPGRAVRQRRRVVGGAAQDGGVEAALPGVVDQAVRDSVERVAGVERRLVQERVLLLWNVAGLVLENDEPRPHRRRREMRPVVRGRAGDDAVEVLREALGFLQPLLAARGAAVPVGVLRRARRRKPPRSPWRAPSSGARPARRSRSPSPGGRAPSSRPSRRSCVPCPWPRSRSRGGSAPPRAGWTIAPSQPPLPTAWNLPFQPSAGSQTSIRISESGVGVSVAVTRQNAGRSA